MRICPYSITFKGLLREVHQVLINHLKWDRLYMKVNRLTFFLLQVVVFSLFFASQSAAEVAEVRIGVLNELSGPLASLGVVCSRGIDLAVKDMAPGNQINGTPVKIIMADERDDSKAAVIPVSNREFQLTLKPRTFRDGQVVDFVSISSE